MKSIDHIKKYARTMQVQNFSDDVLIIKKLSQLISLTFQGYNPDNLPLTVSFKDGRKIDQCVIVKDKIIADKCSTKTSNCGSAVLVNYS